MSQHRIVGSEAFQRRPLVYIRTLRPGALHRRGQTVAAFTAGAIVAAVLGLAAVAFAFAPAGTF